MNKTGEHAAEIQKKFLSWLINTIARKFKKRVLYSFSTPYRRCSVKFIIETDNELAIKAAVENIRGAGMKAKHLIDAMNAENPTELVYIFNEEGTFWVPSYLMTQTGKVYTDRPYLMANEDFGGLSIEGSCKRQEQIDE